MSDINLVNYGELDCKLSDYLATDGVIILTAMHLHEIVDDILKLVNECSYPDNKIQTLEAKVKELEQTILRMTEGIEFYTHEKPREGYDCEKVAGVMMGHRYDIACGACNEDNKGKLARKIQKETASVVEKLRGKE